MTYYDDEDDNGQNPPPAGRQPPRGDFRADPSFSPRSGYPQQPAVPPQQQPHPQADHSPMDEYVQPRRHAAPPPQPLSATPAPEPHVDPAAAGYRAQAQDPHADPQYQQQPYYQGGTAQQAQDAYYQEYEQQHAGYYQAPPPRRRNLLNVGIIAGAVVVFGGIIFYAYNQGMRAGTESVAPILRADGSPTKIRPEQPGGMEVPHQDKLVYDRLNPASNAPPGEVERLLPPPETPMERPRADAVEQGEDMPLAEEGEGAVAAMRGAPAEEPPVQQPAPQPVPSYAPPVQQPARTAPPPAQQQPQQLLPQTQAQPAPQKPVNQALVVPPTAAAPATSPPATPKPATGGASVRVQVAAVDAEGKAAAEWQRLQRKFAGELGGLSMRTVRAQLPKGIFYRIQGGPVDEARAKQICAAMVAQGAGCSIVR